MNDHETPVVSGLPVAAFMLPVVAGLLVLLGRRLGRVWWEAMAVVASVGVLAVGVAMARLVAAGAVLTSWGNQVRVDGLSALMVLVIGVIGFLATVYAVRYVRQPGWTARVGSDVARNRTWAFYWLTPWFLGSMLWACVTNNIVVLYLAVEATTLASGLLVAFYWDRKALEAGYKYLMLLTVGLTFALFGCVLTYAAAAATGEVGTGGALLLSEIRKVIHLVAPGTAAITVALLVVGFGTKAGLAPFHPWLPDAHAEAPTPISVLLSGVMIKVAVYAMARTVNVFFPAWPALTTYVVALGSFAMLFGIIMAFAQDDLKRLLAFSSVSQMGYIVAGVGMGTYVGIYGGLFHLVNHSIFKSLLFLSVGAVIYATGGLRRISQVSGLGRKMPVTALCFFVGALAIGGMPPFNGFMSKFTLFVGFVKGELMWAAVIAVVTSLLTLACLVRAAYLVFWGAVRCEGAPIGQEPREVPVSMWGGMVVLAGLALVIGVYPQMLYPFLNTATKCVLEVVLPLQGGLAYAQ